MSVITSNASAASMQIGGIVARKSRGRPTKFSEEIAKQICGHISDGVPLCFCAALVSISPETLAAWQRKYPQFYEAVETARARGIASRLAIIRKAIEGSDASLSARCAMWYLERVYPAHFARTRLELSGPDGGPLSAGVGIYLPKKDEEPGPTIEMNPVTDPQTNETDI